MYRFLIDNGMWNCLGTLLTAVYGVNMQSTVAATTAAVMAASNSGQRPTRSPSPVLQRYASLMSSSSSQETPLAAMATSPVVRGLRGARASTPLTPSRPGYAPSPTAASHAMGFQSSETGINTPQRQRVDAYRQIQQQLVAHLEAAQQLDQQAERMRQGEDSHEFSGRYSQTEADAHNADQWQQQGYRQKQRSHAAQQQPVPPAGFQQRERRSLDSAIYSPRQGPEMVSGLSAAKPPGRSFDAGLGQRPSDSAPPPTIPRRSFHVPHEWHAHHAPPRRARRHNATPSWGQPARSSAGAQSPYTWSGKPPGSPVVCSSSGNDPTSATLAMLASGQARRDPVVLFKTACSGESAASVSQQVSGGYDTSAGTSASSLASPGTSTVSGAHQLMDRTFGNAFAAADPYHRVPYGRGSSSSDNSLSTPAAAGATERHFPRWQHVSDLSNVQEASQLYSAASAPSDLQASNPVFGREAVAPSWLTAPVPAAAANPQVRGMILDSIFFNLNNGLRRIH